MLSLQSGEHGNNTRVGESVNVVAFAFLKPHDAHRVRVKELRGAIQRYGVRKVSSRCKKMQLVDHLCKAQVARRFSRACAARIRSRRSQRHQVGFETHPHLAVAIRVQRWWRHIRRFVANNRVDPITLDTFVGCSDDHGDTFIIVGENGHVYRYFADPLYLLLHSQLGAEEPICRRILTIPELQRLDTKVSGHLLIRHGSSVNILSNSSVALGMTRTKSREIALYMEDSMDAIISDLATTLCFEWETESRGDSNINNDESENDQSDLPVTVVTVPIDICQELLSLAAQFKTHDNEACEAYLSLKLKDLNAGQMPRHLSERGGGDNRSRGWCKVFGALLRAAIDQIRSIQILSN